MGIYCIHVSFHNAKAISMLNFSMNLSFIVRGELVHVLQVLSRQNTRHFDFFPREQEKKRKAQREKTKKQRKEVSLPWKTLGKLSDDEEEAGAKDGRKRELKRKDESSEKDGKDKKKSTTDKRKITMESQSARQKSL